MGLGSVLFSVPATAAMSRAQRAKQAVIGQGCYRMATYGTLEREIRVALRLGGSETPFDDFGGFEIGGYRSTPIHDETRTQPIGTVC